MSLPVLAILVILALITATNLAYHAGRQDARRRFRSDVAQYRRMELAAYHEVTATLIQPTGPVQLEIEVTSN